MVRQLLSDPLLSLIAALCLALLFAVAAVHKVWAGAKFSAILRNYGVPEAFCASAGVAIAAVEFAIAAALLWPASRGAAAIAASTLLLGYAAMLASALYARRSIDDCGCSFGRPQPVQAPLVWRNLILAVVAALLALPVGSRPLGPLDAFVCLAAVAAISALYLLANTLLANQPRTRELADV